MNLLPGLHVVVEKVPELGTPRGALRAAASVFAIAAIALAALLWLDRRWPFVAFLAQLLVYLVLRWLVAGFYRGRQDRVPYAEALYNRCMPSVGLNLASMLYVLLTAGALTLLAPKGVEVVPFVPFAGGAIVTVYLLASALVLLGRALRSAGLDTIMGVYVFYPNEGRQLEDATYTLLRHPLYAALDRIVLAFALWNGSAYAVLLAVVFIAVWHPAWYGLEERELLDRFGADYDAYAKRTPAVIPQSLAGERALWQSLLRQGG